MANTGGRVRDVLLMELASFSGSEISLLGEVEAKLQTRPEYVSALIELCGRETGAIDTGVTWLLKSHLERGRRLDSDMQTQLLERLADIRAWAACLHLCQLVRYLDLSSVSSGKIVIWAENLCTHDRPFVRAWALDALCFASNTVSSFQALAKKRFEHAESDPKASVRARARHLKTEFTWLD